MEVNSFQLIFIPQIEYKTNYGTCLKTNSPIFNASNSKAMLWQTGDIWTNCWTISLNSLVTFEYHYIVSDRENNLFATDVIRKLNLSDFSIDFKKNSIGILTVNDIWGFPDKSRIAYDQLPLIEDKCCIVLGKNLAFDGSPSIDLISRMDKLSKILKNTKKQYYKFAILTGGKVKQTVNYEAEVMYDLGLKLGIDAGVMIKEKEAKTTLENAVFCKIIAMRMGFVNYEIISSGYHLKRSESIFKGVFGKGFAFKMVDDEAELEKEWIKRNNQKEEYLLCGLDKLLDFFGFLA